MKKRKISEREKIVSSLRLDDDIAFNSDYHGHKIHDMKSTMEADLDAIDISPDFVQPLTQDFKGLSFEGKERVFFVQCSDD